MFGMTKHCPVCGMDVKKDTPFKRFGKSFCSDEHAQKYTDMQMTRQKDEDQGSGCCC
ncbi:hypothetical protein [Candidatus Nitrosotalea okcheonensis]|uniref:TRASH domain-containing protein n=1 Tax=Candidatus Nitrosotalea okcheonensis TaxID=1903276 RepID=A0A2H1FDS3_9ARCH|nr:hypothetical protein [Candidatus Nitrosotalea okcheonensis]SMH70914.1 conserved protein of unknown function [Candidatus Nitrosotalea okcheonensis]